MTGLGSLIYGTVTDQMAKGIVLFDFSDILRPLKRGAKVSRRTCEQRRKSRVQGIYSDEDS